MTMHPPPSIDPLDVARHADSVRALAHRLLRDSGAAEDAAQEAWLVALRARRAPTGSLGAWVRGVLRNVVRHARRDAATRQRHETLATPGPKSDDPAEIVARTELHHRLVGAVLALDEPYRGTVLARYFEGLDAAAIARRDGVPAGTVRSRLKRGLDILRERLDREHDGDRRRWALLLVPVAGVPSRLRPRRLLVAAAAVCAVLVAGIGAERLGAFDGHGPAPPDGGNGNDTADAGDSRRTAPVRATDDRAGRAQRPSAALEDPAAADPEPAGAPADVGGVEAGTTGVSIEVVDEAGERVRDGVIEVELDIGLDFEMRILDRIEAWAHHLGEKRLAEGNPCVVRDLPKEMDGLALKVLARVPGSPPTAPTRFSVQTGKVESVRLTLSKPRTAAVVVLDRKSGLPVAGASVVSTTEISRRDLEVAAVRGVPGPGSAVTDGEGRCSVADLGPGEHEIEVDAGGYVRGEADWAGDELRVRLEPLAEAATVTVHVLGPQGEPVPDVRVSRHDSDEVRRTDAAGVCVFESVSPGMVTFRVEIQDWVAARSSRGWTAADETYFAMVRVESGGRHVAEIGWPRPGKATFTARVLDGTDAPVPGVLVRLSGAMTVRPPEKRTDGTGVAVFDGVRKGEHFPVIRLADGTDWWFDAVEIPDGARLERTFRLGAETVRGRAVTKDGRPVARARIAFSGPRSGFATTDAEGRFVLGRAPAGTYVVESNVGDGGARRTGVVVPSAEEIVLTLVPYGRVEVRVRDGEGALLRRAKVRIVLAGDRDDGDRDADGWSFQPGTSVDERLRSVDLVPGRYEVVVEDDGRTARFPAEVRPGETCVVEVRAP